MRLVVAALLLAGCAGGEANPYPNEAKAQFEASCPASDPVCACTWDDITHAMTYEEYQEALQRFRETGLMDPHITHARTHCIEHRTE